MGFGRTNDRGIKMKKSTKTGVIYAFYTPLSVFSGYMLAKNEYIISIIIIFILMLIEYFSVKLWIEAQTEDIKS
jgi:hypothetical protein